MLAATIPLPTLDSTPPVTKTNLALTNPAHNYYLESKA
jgi:hypothetical protein